MEKSIFEEAFSNNSNKLYFCILKKVWLLNLQTVDICGIIYLKRFKPRAFYQQSSAIATLLCLPFCYVQTLAVKGQNLGRVFNSRLGHACVCCAIAYITKQPNLKLKTRPKQLLGSLPLTFTLPSKSFFL
jgi:hypothetical protein